MSSNTPFKNPQGIPMCPKCKILLPEGPLECPQCRQPLRGPKLHRRTALGCLLGLIPGAAIIGANRYMKSRIPEVREGPSAPVELTVKPDTTHWESIRAKADGEMLVQVVNGPVPIGFNVAPLGSGGLTPELRDKVRETGMEVAAGKSAEMTQPVQAGKTYAIFVMNDSDNPASVRITTTLRRK